MQEFLSFVLNILSNGIPLSVAIMISGAFFVWLSTHNTKFLGEKSRRFLYFSGFVIFFIGLIFSIIILIFQIYKDESEQITNLVNFLSDLYLIRNPLFWGYVIFIFLSFIVFSEIRKKIILNGYSIVFKETVYKSNEKQNALIQVENVGRGKALCEARLAKVSMKKSLSGKEEDLFVKYINPNAFPLFWNKSGNNVYLENGSPAKIINLVSGEFYVSSGKSSFNFSNDKGIVPSENLNAGFYRVTIDLFAILNGKRYKIASVEKELRIGESKLYWLGNENPKTKDVKIKTQKNKVIKKLQNLKE